jgi:hypothetical protein
MSPSKIALAEAASRLNSTPLNLLMHIKRGLLSAEEIDGQWWIDGASFAAFQQQHRGKTANNLCQSSCTHKCPSCG